MGAWSEHGSATGGYYKCNKYEELKNDKNSVTKAEEKREQAQHELKKYMFFYERYNNHIKAGAHAQEMEPKIKILVEKLNSEKLYPIAELTFLETALDIVIKCRKVLKWTYAYGYYLEDVKEKMLFEDAQEQLEKNCDRLHEYLEQDFEPFLNEEQLDKKPFYIYKDSLVTRYEVTRQFYENLLDALQTGLATTT
jgi:ariadne-1